MTRHQCCYFLAGAVIVAVLFFWPTILAMVSHP